MRVAAATLTIVLRQVNPAPSNRNDNCRLSRARRSGRRARHGGLAPGAYAGARSASGRNTDRQSRRHHAARAVGPAQCRPHSVRGHEGHRPAAGAFRDRQEARHLSRPQCRAGSSRRARRAAPRRKTGAGIRCRHAAGFRSRFQAGARGARRGVAGDCRTGTFGGADGADPVRPAAGPVSVRRVPAAAFGGTAPGVGAMGGARSNADLFRGSLAPRRRRLPTWPRFSAAREAAVARELTKRHEEIRRGRLDALARHYRESGPPRGEAVIVVGPPEAAPVPDDGRDRRAAAGAARRHSLRDAVALLADETGMARRTLYERALALTREKPEAGDDEKCGPHADAAPARAAARRSGGVSLPRSFAVALMADRRPRLALPGRRDRHNRAARQGARDHRGKGPRHRRRCRLRCRRRGSAGALCARPPRSFWRGRSLPGWRCAST